MRLEGVAEAQQVDGHVLVDDAARRRVVVVRVVRVSRRVLTQAAVRRSDAPQPAHLGTVGVRVRVWVRVGVRVRLGVGVRVRVRLGVSVRVIIRVRVRVRPSMAPSIVRNHAFEPSSDARPEKSRGSSWSASGDEQSIPSSTTTAQSCGGRALQGVAGCWWALQGIGGRCRALQGVRGARGSASLIESMIWCCRVWCCRVWRCRA